ncbi:hypothetical protein F444_20971 [Phytophthora nicotianae P1976]|uniref:CCHC-type domain-containing protein n=1 Tax=Phytophthora nicotianae P1976 TaxID=1317066 RepID=A0A080Z2N6_PHYNI|nr:hypothetical protein F444_20971 [Phytophthora nicotianae P1976]
MFSMSDEEEEQADQSDPPVVEGPSVSGEADGQDPGRPVEASAMPIDATQQRRALVETAEGRGALLGILTGTAQVPGPGEPRASRSWSSTPTREGRLRGAALRGAGPTTAVAGTSRLTGEPGVSATSGGTATVVSSTTEEHGEGAQGGATVSPAPAAVPTSAGGKPPTTSAFAGGYEQWMRRYAAPATTPMSSPATSMGAGPGRPVGRPTRQSRSGALPTQPGQQPVLQPVPAPTGVQASPQSAGVPRTARQTSGSSTTQAALQQRAVPRLVPHASQAGQPHVQWQMAPATTGQPGALVPRASVTQTSDPMQQYVDQPVQRALQRLVTGSSGMSAPAPASASTWNANVPIQGAATPGTARASSLSMGAIPSYGGVSIGMATGTGGFGYGVTPSNTPFPPFQPPMMRTAQATPMGSRAPAWTPVASGVAAPMASGGFVQQPVASGMATSTPSGEFVQQPVVSSAALPGTLPYGSVTNRPFGYQAGIQGGQSGQPQQGYGPQTGLAAGGIATMGPAPGSGVGPVGYPLVGISTDLRNAVKVIVPFYSDTASSERAAAFWRSLRNARKGWTGKTGQEWWYNSRIEDFESLRVRFHNRFICQTPAQMWERLKKARRNKGESAEEWADRISKIFDALNYGDARMWYESFLGGIRNKPVRAMLNSSMVMLIEEACALLLYKNLHLPVEEEDEFLEDKRAATDAKKETSPELQMLQQMQKMNMMLVQQQQLQTVQQPRSPSQSAVNAVAAETKPQRTAQTSASGTLEETDRTPNIRTDPDSRTQEGVTVCGRCGRRGCSRATCPRATGTWNRCGKVGHYSVECSVPRPQNSSWNRNAGRRQQSGRPNTCSLCGANNHPIWIARWLKRFVG